MKKFKVRATNLHQGAGEIEVEKIINALDEESARKEYLNTYMTIEIHSIREVQSYN